MSLKDYRMRFLQWKTWNCGSNDCIQQKWKGAEELKKQIKEVEKWMQSLIQV
jgi:hypothetical protein